MKELEIIDIHTHATGLDVLNFYTPRIPSVQSLTELDAKMKECGVKKAAVFPFPGTLYYNPLKILNENIWEPSGLENFPYQVENRALLAEIRIRNWKEKFYPFLAFDPKERVEEQCQFLREQSGFFGIKVHTLATRSQPADVSPKLVEILEERNIPIMFHTGRQDNTSPDRVVEFSRQNRQLRVGLTHLAGLDAETLLEAQRHPNLFIDTSPFLCICYFAARGINKYLSSHVVGIDFSDTEAVLLELYRILGENLIWGSDEPFSCFSNKEGKIVVNFTYSEQMDVLKRLIFSGYQHIVQKIAVENTQRFLFG